MRKYWIALFIAFSAPPAIYLYASQQVLNTETTFEWKKLDQGLFLGEYISPVQSKIGDSKITILKIDPALYSFHLVTANSIDDSRKTAPEWCKEKGFIAAINAGMYQPDGRNVGYMKNYKKVITSNFAGGQKSVLAFNPKDETVPEIQLIDMGCDDFKTLIEKYNTCSQSIRMIDCNRKNVWSQQPKQWSMVVWGMDGAGNALMIFCRSPYSVHDFINILKNAPIDISRCMYLEGGPEASLYLKSGNTERRLFGSYETGFYESDGSMEYWPVPNMVGIKKK